MLFGDRVRWPNRQDGLGGEGFWSERAPCGLVGWLRPKHVYPSPTRSTGETDLQGSILRAASNSGTVWAQSWGVLFGCSSRPSRYSSSNNNARQSNVIDPCCPPWAKNARRSSHCQAIPQHGMRYSSIYGTSGEMHTVHLLAWQLPPSAKESPPGPGTQAPLGPLSLCLLTHPVISCRVLQPVACSRSPLPNWLCGCIGSIGCERVVRLPIAIRSMVHAFRYLSLGLQFLSHRRGTVDATVTARSSPAPFSHSRFLRCAIPPGPTMEARR